MYQKTMKNDTILTPLSSKINAKKTFIPGGMTGGGGINREIG